MGYTDEQIEKFRTQVDMTEDKARFILAYEPDDVVTAPELLDRLHWFIDAGEPSPQMRQDTHHAYRCLIALTDGNTEIPPLPPEIEFEPLDPSLGFMDRMREKKRRAILKAAYPIIKTSPGLKLLLTPLRYGETQKPSTVEKHEAFERGWQIETPVKIGMYWNDENICAWYGRLLSDFNEFRRDGCNPTKGRKVS